MNLAINLAWVLLIIIEVCVVGIALVLLMLGIMKIMEKKAYKKAFRKHTCLCGATFLGENIESDEFEGVIHSKTRCYNVAEAIT